MGIAASTSPRHKTTVRPINASKMLTINTVAQSILCLLCVSRRGLFLVLSVIIVRIPITDVISEITMINTWIRRSLGLRSKSSHSHIFSTARTEVEIREDCLKTMFLRDTYHRKQNTKHYKRLRSNSSGHSVLRGQKLSEEEQKSFESLPQTNLT